MSHTLLDNLLREFPTAKRQTLKEMVQQRRVLINDVPARKLSQPVGESDVVRVRPRAAVAPRPPRVTLHPLKKVYEDDDILVIDKPAGLLTSTVPGEKRATVLAIVRRYVEATSPRARVGLIHRLDRDASGLLVFSKSRPAYDALKTQFFKHTVERMYEATVHGKPNPPKGRIESRLVERADGSVRSTDEHARGQRAISDYEVVRTEKNRSLVRITLLTGRKHQIRVHLSERGWPIVGDTVYGDAKAGPLMLRAVRLALDHPRTGKRVAFEAVED
jgi:23S rRNA pseudouridine1911/1915/1917 synthase